MRRTIPIKAEDSVKSYQAGMSSSVGWVWQEGRQLAPASRENSLAGERTVNPSHDTSMNWKSWGIKAKQGHSHRWYAGYLPVRERLSFIREFRPLLWGIDFLQGSESNLWVETERRRVSASARSDELGFEAHVSSSQPLCYFNRRAWICILLLDL